MPSLAFSQADYNALGRTSIIELHLPAHEWEILKAAAASERQFLWDFAGQVLHG